VSEGRADDAGAPRPQSVLLVYFGDFVADEGVLVASSSVVDLLDRVGVGEAAARATLSRMTRRGLLRREVRGRRAYFGLTEHGLRTVVGGRTRVRDDGVAATSRWDGAWTVVAFSMPETWQRERHDLRARLGWAGFGMVQAGLWVAPRRVDVPAVVDGLGLDDHLRVFEGAPAGPTDAGRLVAEAYDLGALARRYTGFLERWSDGDSTDGEQADGDRAASGPDPLARLVVLGTDWLQVVRDDPRLPLDFLPEGWPAVSAETLYRSLLGRLAPAALEQFRRETDVIPDPVRA
jgi:phenylacetic acid degradation operon negative regulatory protein